MNDSLQEGVDRLARDAACILRDIGLDLTGAATVVVDLAAEDETEAYVKISWQLRESALRPEDVQTGLYAPLGTSGVHAGTETGVVLTHVPTGLSAARDDKRSHLQNKAAAMEDLRQLVADYDPELDGDDGGMYGT